MPVSNNAAPDSTTKTKVVIREPKKFQVLLLDEPNTPMDYVVYVLQSVFKMDDPTAKAVMLQVHNNGKGVAGVYDFETAKEKVAGVEAHNAKASYDLPVKMQEA